MNDVPQYQVKTISEFHRLHGLPAPANPLISVADYRELTRAGYGNHAWLMIGLYVVSLKRGVNNLHYGRQEYDFDDGVLYFLAPGQVLKVDGPLSDPDRRSGWLLLIHPDFLWNTSLAGSIRNYEFFDYAIHEALFLSEQEEEVLNRTIHLIRDEYRSTMDRHSKRIIVSHIETLLNYAQRFYDRQFMTREKANHQLVDRVDRLLMDYFNQQRLITDGLPSVQYVADELGVSPGYLGKVMRMVTGRSTQQHIQEHLIAKAKERLVTTDLTVSEIAYSLGFEHPQSFSKLFKARTAQTPKAFRSGSDRRS